MEYIIYLVLVLLWLIGSILIYTINSKYLKVQQQLYNTKDIKFEKNIVWNFDTNTAILQIAALTVIVTVAIFVYSYVQDVNHNETLIEESALNEYKNLLKKEAEEEIYKELLRRKNN